MPNTRISDLTAAVSVAGTDVFPSVQTAGVGPVKTSLTQITNFALANAAAGAVGAPSIAPTGDTNTGFWFPAADTIAASTAGSERLRITSAGNVGIGTTSPSDILEISASSANVTGIRVTNTSQTNQYVRLMMAGSTGFSINGWDNSAILEANATGVGSGTRALVLSAFSGPMIFQVDGRSEKMRITSAGNVGIGTTSPSDRFVVENSSANVVARISAGGSASYTASLGIGTSARDWSIRADGSSTSYLFSINYTGTDAPLSNILNVTKAGNVGIGTTTISGRLTVDTALTGTPGLLVNSSVAASYASTLFYGTTTTAAGAGFDMIGVYANTVAQFRVRGDGTIYAQNTTVQAISDVRLKDNIRSALDGLSTIMRLRPVRFDWKEGYGNGRKNQLGFVAQEVETVFPDAVDEMKISNASDEAFKTVGPSAFIPVLVKAIQELAAELNELKGKINA